jgi:hypothetical protein
MTRFGRFMATYFSTNAITDVPSPVYGCSFQKMGREATSNCAQEPSINAILFFSTHADTAARCPK